MIFRLFSEHLRNQNWFAVGLDLLVVVVGIFLGFQLDGWNEDRQERNADIRLLHGLRDDLVIEQDMLRDVVATTERRIAQLALLDSVFADPELALSRPASFIRALEQVTWRNFPSIRANTYQEIGPSSRVPLLASAEFRRSLASYYAYMDDTADLGFAEPRRNQFDELVVGLHTREQLSAIEDSENFEADFSAAAAFSMATRFSSLQQAHDWIPRLQQYQVLMRVRSNEMIAMADALIAQIDSAINR